MNKKFSTLLASVLLTSAFTVNAETYKPVEGDFVRLSIGGRFLTIEDNDVTGKYGDPNQSPDAYRRGNGTYKDVFAAINSQMWKIAKISKSTSGEPLYQFVNKQTGEYLAINLQNDNKTEVAGVRTTKGISLSPKGNRDWAIKGNQLYAYTSKDSSYTISIDGEGKLSLHSKKGSTAPTEDEAKFGWDNSMPELKLNADAFNVLMKLTGNNGKLNFNNGKDVSSNEDNVLSSAKWRAVSFDGGNTFALTDDSKQTGCKDEPETNGKFKTTSKLNYLQVDTLYHNDQDGYFQLVKDTLPYEYTEGKYFGQKGVQDVKPAATRNAKAAEFTGFISFAKDSIVLKAVNQPKVLNVPGTVYAESILTGYGENYQNEYLAALNATGENAELKAKINALYEAYNNFLIVQNSDQEHEKTFLSIPENQAAYVALVDPNTSGQGSNVSAFKRLLEDYKIDKAYITPGRVEGAAGLKTDFENAYAAAVKPTSSNAELQAKIDELATAMEKVQKAILSFLAYENRGNATSSNFGAMKFGADGNVAETGSTGTELVEAFTGVRTFNYAAINASFGEYMDKVSAYSALITSTSIATKTAAAGTLTNSSAAAIPGIEPAKDAALAVGAANTTVQQNLIALNDAYRAFVAENDGKSFASIVTLGEQLIDGKEVTDVISETSAANVAGYTAISGFLTKLGNVQFEAAVEDPDATVPGEYFTNGKDKLKTEPTDNGEIVLRKLGKGMVLTIVRDIDADEDLEELGYTLPLIQPYATTGGDAKIAETSYHFIQVKNKSAENVLRAASLENKYWAIDWITDEPTVVSEVSEYNPYTQWAFVEGSTGAYSIINRATGEPVYSGALYKVADAENTFTNGSDTIKVAAVEIPESAIVTEGKNKYDVSGAFYAGKDEKLINRLFAINPVSPFMSQLAAQYNKDSLMILGAAADAPVWRLKEVEKDTDEGYVIDGTAPLLYTYYSIYTTDADKNVYYVTLNEEGTAYILSDDESKLGSKPTIFTFPSVAENQYLIVAASYDEDDDDYNIVKKMTINPTPAKPILEASELDSERNDLFTFSQVNQSVYRTLTAEDGVLGNAKIYMENEPNRYLYENTANIVANNGKGLNFLGIYNTAELTKNAAMFIDTAYVNREDNLMPQYMLGLNVETVPAKEAVACTYEHNHYDNAGNKVDAEHCSHATPATFGYKTGRYLVALSDSVPENGSANSPVYYDGKNVRLAFVDAIHYLTQDTVVIKKSKYTGNSKQQVAGDKKTWAAKDTLAISGDGLNAATFALKYKDQATKSFYLESAGEKYVRILNGVPVLTNSTEDAAVFNIEATTEEATANEAIEAAGVQVIGGKGAVTVQGAAGKVITVANVLGQTIANQVAASDNVTIAVPAGIVVVAVEGEATKVVVK